MSKLDSAYDIDPLFHKMSKSFDEGGAKGLLLGNLGVSTSGCHVVFDSKEAPADTRGAAAGKPELEKIEEGAEENEAEDGSTAEESKADAEPAWKESQIDITNLSAKLEQMLASYGHETSATVPFVPQLESLRQDYARLEEEGYGVDEYSCECLSRESRRIQSPTNLPKLLLSLTRTSISVISKQPWRWAASVSSCTMPTRRTSGRPRRAYTR